MTENDLDTCLEVLLNEDLRKQVRERETELPPPIVKECPCCHAEYSALQWVQLPFCGFMTDEVDSLELRTCECGSTIAIELI